MINRYRMRNNKLYKVVGAIVLAATMYACTTVPITGRKQLTGVPGAPGTQEIITMSADTYVHLMDSVQLSQDQEQVNRIKRVGNKIKGAVEEYLTDNGYQDLLQGFNWEFNLIKDDDMVNAWAMPGGKVAFYTGIMPICQDDLGVAVVMGHEVAHAIAKHGEERINQTYAKQVGMTVGAIALGENPGVAEQLIYESVGYGTDLGLLSFSRTHESEADELGLVFMAIAGYDPREAPKFWERMSANSGGNQPPEFLSTHPSHETRIERLNEAMPKALEYYMANK